MLLDRVMPDYHSHEVHSIAIPDPPSNLYEIVRNLDFSSSLLTRILFFMRGLGTDRMTLDRLIGKAAPFRLIAESQNEFVAAGIGRPGGGLVVFRDEEEFRRISRGGLIKIGWNFSLVPTDRSTVIVRTETRILSTDLKARIIFALYWTVVRPFSGLIRREMLRLIREKAERS